MKNNTQNNMNLESKKDETNNKKTTPYCHTCKGEYIPESSHCPACGACGAEWPAFG